MTEKTIVPIVKNRLYWISHSQPPRDIPKAFFFNIDNDLVYEGFYQDFGPLHLAKVWKYVTEVNKILHDKQYADNVFYHHTSTDPKKSSNSCLLMCCFQMIALKRTAEEAFQPFKNVQFRPFRDASYGDCTYKCTILDCLKGIQYAMKLGWFQYKKFNVTEYEHYEKVQNGDLNWIIPGKFIAFSTPSDSTKDKYGNLLYTPKDYVPIFKKLGVTTVVRLNTKTYDATEFLKNDINHVDLYFTDGTAPPQEIVQKFLKLAEEDNGVVAVHCKAGLGRTGTLIGCYAMKHFHFNAADFIGWIRLCRPGSILGPQQHWMIENQKKMKGSGKDSLIWKEISQKMDHKDVQKQMNSFSIKDTKMNEKEKKILLKGDIGQGEKLTMAKKKINGLVN